MKRMQSTPIIVSRPDRKDNIPAMNLSPILSTEASSTTTTLNEHSALSTLYANKVGNYTAKTEINEFSHWLGPKIASTTNIKNPLDGTYIEKAPEKSDIMTDPSNKENALNTELDNIVPLNPGQLSVLSDILNKQNGPTLRSPDKISITVNKQSSVWLNSSRDYAKEPETDNKDMEELHTELDKILDQLQKLVT